MRLASPMLDRLRAWWRDPRLTTWVFVVIALLVFLRKPHALHTPQLWAEDGSIFLAFNDLDGAKAFVTPYMGYLHTLPRLIAWAASRLLDPAWWPAFYNGVAFVIWVAVIARTFSRRLDVPGKPWLALAFLVGPQTGEILLNATNLQWITAFVFVQQVLMRPPQTRGQRITDIVLLTLAGLTGPFAIALLPLFVWRWWRERSGYAVTLLLVVAACAAIQAGFIVQAGTGFDANARPFDAVNAVVVLARRLLLWPAFGERIALGAPAVIVGIIGVLASAAAIVWWLRPAPRRLLRAQVLAAFALMIAAALYRTRADTWMEDNLVFSDRYFYMPRVLLAWLIVWEFDAPRRAIALAAAALYASTSVIHLRDYFLPAPINYHWESHCDPIRRGVPAKIPILPEGWTLDYRGRSSATKDPRQ